ncbi:hypothetical protein [Arenibaculum pallidiluteum]|uniref:hypothetical protein n=1 Tax=Arenibaculum pallidiluteum TaxID=2812559 RepID=UPI001A97AD5F|nr:hypothetical protein [Arenibaculum pallidiluteum]
MPNYTKPAIPKVLTDAEWQKKKGAIAKLAGETGVGAALKAMEAAFKKVNWDKFDMDKQIPSNSVFDVGVVDAALAAAGDEMKNLEPLRKTIMDVDKKASDAAAKFKSNKLIPKESAAYAAQVAKEASNFLVVVNKSSIGSAVEKDAAAARVNIEKKVKLVQDSAKSYLAKVAKGLDGQTVETYADYWKESLRGLAAALSRIPGQETLTEAWRPWVSQKGIPKDEKQLSVAKTKVKELVSRTQKELA